MTFDTVLCNRCGQGYSAIEGHDCPAASDCYPRPPSQKEVKTAILSILGGLPPCWEMLFYWEDGKPCLKVIQPGKVEYFALRRDEEGRGHFEER